MFFFFFFASLDANALILVVLKSYIAIFSTTKYKFMTILVEQKPNNLAPQLQGTAKSGCAQ